MMIDFSPLVLDDLSPIYLQIVRFLKIHIVLGSAHPGDELPSRRVLSAMLGVNPNTIQKACKIMEDEGILVSYAGSKSILQYDEGRAKRIKQELIQNEVGQYIAQVSTMGIEKSEAARLVEKNWQEFAGEYHG